MINVKKFITQNNILKIKMANSKNLLAGVDGDKI